MGNQFVIEILPDGKIKVTSPGGFSREMHQDADDFLAFIKDLAGGPCETKVNKPSLGNPHQQGHSHGGHYHTH